MAFPRRNPSLLPDASAILFWLEPDHAHLINAVPVHAQDLDFPALYAECLTNFRDMAEALEDETGKRRR